MRSQDRGRLVVCGALVALAALGTAACGKSVTPRADGGSAGAAVKDLVTETPPGNGPVERVTWALPYGEPTTLDPIKVGDFSPNTVVANLCDNLLRTNSDFSVGPGIAERWKYEDDRTLVLRIRKGVTFSNGDPLTADDVVFSLNRARSTTNGSIDGYVYVNVDTIEKTGPSEVTIRLKEPDSTLLRELGTVAAAIVDAKATRALGQKVGTPNGNVACSGPFTLSRWEPGEQIILEAREGYWDKQLQPQVKQLVFRFISDTSTLTNALTSGEVDGAFGVPPSAIPQLSGTSAGKLYLGPSTEVEQILPAAPTGPMSDPEVRRALALVIDRPGLAKVVFNGAARPDRTIAPPFSWQSDPARKTWQEGYDALPDLNQDLAAAKKLVDANPVAKQPFTIAVIAGDQVQRRTATLIQSAAKQVGLRMKLRLFAPPDYSNLFYVASARKGVDGILTLGYIEAADPMDRLALFVPKDGLFNWTKYADTDVQSLVAQARATLDPEKHATLVNEAQKGYMGDMLVIPILNVVSRTFVSKRISGTTTSFAYTQRPWAAMLGAAG